MASLRTASKPLSYRRAGEALLLRKTCPQVLVCYLFCGLSRMNQRGGAARFAINHAGRVLLVYVV